MFNRQLVTHNYWFFCKFVAASLTLPNRNRTWNDTRWSNFLMKWKGLTLTQNCCNGRNPNFSFANINERLVVIICPLFWEDLHFVRFPLAASWTSVNEDNPLPGRRSQTDYGSKELVRNLFEILASKVSIAAICR